MTEPPNLNHHIVPADEMDKLYRENKFDEKLLLCQREPVEQQKTQAVLMHETFCCRKVISRFIDPTSKDEIALIAEYIKLDQSKSRVISRLRIGNDVYNLKLL
jgi:hypothetical protein